MKWRNVDEEGGTYLIYERKGKTSQLNVHRTKKEKEMKNDKEHQQNILT